MKPPRKKKAPIPAGYIPFPLRVCRKATYTEGGYSVFNYIWISLPNYLMKTQKSNSTKTSAVSQPCKLSHLRGRFYSPSIKIK